jgi:hypothetical protein
MKVKTHAGWPYGADALIMLTQRARIALTISMVEWGFAVAFQSSPRQTVILFQFLCFSCQIGMITKDQLWQEQEQEAQMALLKQIFSQLDQQQDAPAPPGPTLPPATSSKVVDFPPNIFDRRSMN